jgi:hypothetical protein
MPVLLCPPATATEFRAGSSAAVSFSSCNEYIAVGQQGRRVKKTAGTEATCDRPSSAGRVIQFRARLTVITRRNEDAAVG